MSSKTLLLMTLGLMLAVSAVGQAIYGNITGAVTDPAGAVVPDAHIAIHDVDRGGDYDTIANSSGNFTQTHLLPGHYSIRVTATGFAEYTATAVVQVNVPQLLGSPQLLPDGSLQLTSVDANGGQLQPSDLPNFEAQASTDLVNWTTLPNALSLTNGVLQLQDATRTNYTTRFYRIVENPAP